MFRVKRLENRPRPKKRAVELLILIIIIIVTFGSHKTNDKQAVYHYHSTIYSYQMNELLERTRELCGTSRTRGQFVI